MSNTENAASGYNEDRKNHPAATPNAGCQTGFVNRSSVGTLTPSTPELNQVSEPVANPFTRNTREWVEWEDAYFRRMNETGEFQRLAKAIMAAAEEEANADNYNVIDVDGVIYADVEDGKVFVICSALVNDTNAEMSKVMQEVEDRGLSLESDTEEDNPRYLSGKARVRWFV